MLKKLTEKQQQAIIDSAIEEFGRNGLERAQIGSIARKAGISVGVIYKYYRNKEALIDTCLRHSVDILKKVLSEAVGGEADLMKACEKLIRACISFSREEPRYIEMYHAVTMKRGAEAARYADEIEGAASVIYTRLLEEARARGEVRGDLDPAAFAMFFDNLLMMTHFAYGVDYYRERLGLYKPGSAERDEELVSQLMLFVRGALGAGDAGTAAAGEPSGPAGHGEAEGGSAE